MVHSLRHLRENICQILERIYAEELARSNDGENDSRSASGFRASGEHPVFSADGERPDAIFDEIIADLDPAVFEEVMSLCAHGHKVRNPSPVSGSFFLTRVVRRSGWGCGLKFMQFSQPETVPTLLPIIL